MAEREELILSVETDADRARQEMRDLERETENVEEAFEDTGTAAQRAGRALVQVAEDTRQEMVQAKEAADALGQALGPELSSKADLDAVVADLQRMGLTLEDIRAEADTLATAMKQVDDVRLQGLSEGVDITRQRMDGLRSSSDQSRSVLANLAGNASQDLGELAGVTGTLGVGLGQLAEYAVDGNISLSNLAKVAGPMLGVAAAATLIGTAISGIKAEQAFRADLVEKFRDALGEGAEAAQTLYDIVRQTGELEFSDQGGILGLGQETEDLLPVLDRLGISFSQFMQLVETRSRDGGATVDAFFAQMREALGLTVTQFSPDLDALADGLDQYGQAIADAAAGQEVFNRVMAGAEPTVADVNQALQDNSDELLHIGELWDTVIRDMERNGFVTEDSIGAYNRLAEVLGLSNDELAEMANQKLAEWQQEAADAAAAHAENLRSLGEQLATVADGLDTGALRAAGFASALSNINSNVSELDASQETITFADRLNALGDALRELDDFEGDLVPDSWDEVQNMPEELGPVVAALGQFRDVMQGEFAQAFEQGGSTEARQWAENTRTAIVDELREAGIEAPEQVNEILSALGLLPDQVETTIQISNAEQARTVLDDIGSVIANLPPETQLKITALAATDPVAALQLALDALQASGVDVPVELIALTDQLDQDIEEIEFGEHSVRFNAELGNEKKSGKSLSDALSDIADEDRTATIDTEVDTAPADRELDLVALEQRTATIDAVADTSTADAQLDAVAAQRRQAVIDAVLGSIPSPSQIINVATGGQGRLVIPLTGRWSTRIEGSRPR